jgi:hypothetical protein
MSSAIPWAGAPPPIRVIVVRGETPRHAPTPPPSPDEPDQEDWRTAYPIDKPIAPQPQRSKGAKP